MDKNAIKKVVLAYSGGLDTSIIIPWLKENYNNPEIIAVSGDVGQGTELDGLEEKAIKTGASKLYVLDLTEEYVDDYIIPTMKAGAVYEDYLLGTSHARPCIAKGLVEIALKEGADAIFNTALVYELSVLKRHIFPLLQSADPTSPCYDQVRNIVKFLNYVQDASVEDEIPPTSILREFIGGNTFYLRNGREE